MGDQFAVECLSRELIRRKQRNERYSLRAFARDLSLSPSCLWEFLERKRDLSPQSASKIANHLKIPEDSIEQFLLSAQNSRASESLEKEYFELMSYWHYFAILNLARLPENQASPEWIAERLAIKKEDAKTALDYLQDMNLIQIREGSMLRSMKALEKKAKIPGDIIKKHHRSILSQAGLSLIRDPSYMREMRAITIPIDPRFLDTARDLLLECRDKIAALLTNTQSPQLYMLSYYLFPISSLSRN